MKPALAILLVAMLSGLPVSGETLLSPEQFEQDATGKTLYFQDTNLQYSAEQYHPNRRVTLLHLGGSCMHGRWEARDDQMCFFYDEDPGRWHCWHYIERDNGERLHRFVGEPEEPVFELKIVTENRTPIDCPGPAIGVSFPAGPGLLAVPE